MVNSSLAMTLPDPHRLKQAAQAVPQEDMSCGLLFLVLSEALYYPVSRDFFLYFVPVRIVCSQSRST
jgi:hypothetical protein